MNFKEMAKEYLENINIMENRLKEYNLSLKNERGREKGRTIKKKIYELEDVIYQNYKDYYYMKNYCTEEKVFEEDIFKRKCS